MWARTSFGRRGDREVGTEGDTAETNSRIVAAARSFGLVRSLALQVGSASRMLARNADRHPRRSERLTKNRCEARRGRRDAPSGPGARDAVPLSRPNLSTTGRPQRCAESGDEPAVIADWRSGTLQPPLEPCGVSPARFDGPLRPSRRTVSRRCRHPAWWMVQRPSAIGRFRVAVMARTLPAMP
jgi:hypothetical protein